MKPQKCHMFHLFGQTNNPARIFPQFITTAYVSMRSGVNEIIIINGYFYSFPSALVERLSGKSTHMESLRCEIDNELWFVLHQKFSHFIICVAHLHGENIQLIFMHGISFEVSHSFPLLIKFIIAIAWKWNHANNTSKSVEHVKAHAFCSAYSFFRVSNDRNML